MDTSALQTAFLQRKAEKPGLPSLCRPGGAELSLSCLQNNSYLICFSQLLLLNHRALTNHVPLPQARGKKPPLHTRAAADALAQLDAPDAYSGTQRHRVIAVYRALQSAAAELHRPARMPVPATKHAKGSRGVAARQQKRRSWITPPRVTVTPGVHCKRAGPATGFRAPQPKRFTLSCRTGCAEGKGMKLSLPGFG